MAIALSFFAPHEEAAAMIRDKSVVSRDIFYGMLPELRQRAFTITGLQSADVMERVRDEIAAVPRGTKWDDAKSEIASALEPYLGDNAVRRAELLLRTHGFQAFQASTWRTAQADDDTVALQYLTMEDDRVRPSHAVLDGKIASKTDPFWDKHTPPWAWGCRCRIRPMNQDLVNFQREKDRNLPPEKRLVMEGAALDQMRQGTVVNSAGQRVDVTPPIDKPGGADAFQWHPDNLTLPIGEIKLRYSPEAWAAFENFAKNNQIAPGTTLWNSLLSSGATASPEERARQTQQTIRRLAQNAGEINLGGPNESAIRTLARSQFAESQTALGGIRPGDIGANSVGAVAQITRNFIAQWSAEISAVASGRKPLFHEDFSFLNQEDLLRAAEKLQTQVPAGIQVALQDGHLYVYNPSLLTQFTDQPNFANIVEHREDGLWLGYGINFPADSKNAVQVIVIDPFGKQVASFYAPRDNADYFAEKRTEDWSNATGRRYTYAIKGVPPV